VALVAGAAITATDHRRPRERRWTAFLWSNAAGHIASTVPSGAVSDPERQTQLVFLYERSGARPHSVGDWEADRTPHGRSLRASREAELCRLNTYVLEDRGWTQSP